MTATIYKTDDGKYHFLKERLTGESKCGISLIGVETRTIGMKGNKVYPDPKQDEWCPNCFPAVYKK